MTDHWNDATTCLNGATGRDGDRKQNGEVAAANVNLEACPSNSATVDLEACPSNSATVDANPESSDPQRASDNSTNLNMNCAPFATINKGAVTYRDETLPSVRANWKTTGEEVCVNEPQQNTTIHGGENLNMKMPALDIVNKNESELPGAMNGITGPEPNDGEESAGLTRPGQPPKRNCPLCGVEVETDKLFLHHSIEHPETQEMSARGGRRTSSRQRIQRQPINVPAPPPQKKATQKRKQAAKSDCNETKQTEPFVPIRDYYHTGSYQKIGEKEYDVDSDDESNTSWRDLVAESGIHDFEDVSEAEKEFFILWNRFVLIQAKHCIIAKKSLPRRCAEFIEKNAVELHRQNLTDQLLLHLMNLWDYGIISADHVQTLMQQYYHLSAEFYL